MTNVLHVAFRVGAAEYVVPASLVLHLDAFVTATPIPGSAAYVAGLVQVRGRLVPVVDLRVRFGVTSDDQPSVGRRVIVVQSGGRTAGLLADSAREVIGIDVTGFAPPPELVESQATGFVKAVAALGTRLVLLIDVPRILGEEHRHD